MNAKLLFALIITLCAFEHAYSQENFTKAYLIIEKDSLNGYIDYKDWDASPTDVNFKENLNAPTKVYTSQQIDGFGVKNERYISSTVDIENTLTTTNKLEPNPDLDITVETVFLKAIIQGAKSLYYHKSKIGRENFYIQKDGKNELLLYKKHLKFSNGKNKIVEKNFFVSQLNAYLSECTSISGLLKNIDYNINSITKLFNEYYKCSNSTIDFQNKKASVKKAFGVLIGGSRTTLKFTNPEVRFLTDAAFSNSLNFSTGVYFNFIFPRHNGRWTVSNELLYSSYTVEGKYTDFRSEDNYTNSIVKMGYSYLKLNNLLRYKFPLSSAHIYANFGISNGLAIQETNTRTLESFLFSTQRSSTTKALNDTRRFEQGVLLGLGLTHNKFSLEARFEMGNGMSAYSYLKSKTQRYFVLLGYRL